MCGRFYVDQETLTNANGIADYPLVKLNNSAFGDINPSDHSFIMRKEGRNVITEEMKWGFLSFDRKLIINARSESALEKKLFSENIKTRRCVIPARSFYEWNSKKVMNTFSDKNGLILYMAGIFGMFENVPRFTILTTTANDSMKEVHDRMPLILPKENVRQWIYDDQMVSEFLHYRPCELDRRADYEQLSLF